MIHYRQPSEERRRPRRLERHTLGAPRLGGNDRQRAVRTPSRSCTSCGLPVGGLFRHVLDLARAQAARGHQVGIVADASTGGERADAAFAALSPHLALGLSRVPMSRHIGSSDCPAQRHVAQRAHDTHADVLHGHGAKGGAYARLSVRAGHPRLHAAWRQPALRPLLAGRPALSHARTGADARAPSCSCSRARYGRDAFTAKIGTPRSLVRVVHNGVTQEEFAESRRSRTRPIVVFIGELRMLKGVDVLLDALAMLARDGRRVTRPSSAPGPTPRQFRDAGRAAWLGSSIRFLGTMPAREGFARGRVMVAPSRAESLPYIVLEAAAAAFR